MPSTMAEEETDSFQVRVNNAVNGTYQNCMRRSLQSVALYEADRCLQALYSKFRPFQRKIALMKTTVDLLGTLDFLNDYTRQEIMFRTNASKEALTPELAWRRMKVISRDIEQTILPKATKLIENEENSDKTHDEICEMLLQSMYEESTENSKPHPPAWEFNHNNLFTVYRIYFRGVTVDPNIFPATPPRFVEVPAKKPKGMQKAKNGGGKGDPSASLAKMSINSELSDDERRAMLKEVKDHTELLKEFEGVIPEEELVMRKRALFAALPPVPPPLAHVKKQRKKAKAAMAVAATSKQAKAVAIGKDEEDDDWAKLAADDHDEKPTVEKFAHV